MTHYTTDDIIDYNFEDRRKHDITGQTFGHLTALGVVKAGLPKGPLWLLRCQCGTLLTSQHRYLYGTKYGWRFSCGCIKKPRKPRHDRIPRAPAGSEDWKWEKLKQVARKMGERCYNPKAAGYEHYGGRGISICPEWLDDTTTFINWSIENGYAAGLQIDRIDNDGNYSPNNCRWVTPQVNAQNRRTTVIDYEIAQEIRVLLAKGTTPTDIANAMGIARHIVYNIRNNNAWGDKPRNYYREVGLTSHSGPKRPKGDA